MYPHGTEYSHSDPACGHWGHVCCVQSTPLFPKRDEDSFYEVMMTSRCVSISNKSSSVVIESEEISSAFVLSNLLSSESLEHIFVVVFQHRCWIIPCQVNWVSPESKLKSG